MTMTRPSRTSDRLARLLRPSPERFAAAAAVHDPSLLLALQSARPDDAPRDAPARPSRRGRGAGSIREALHGERGAALLLVAAIAIALVWSNSPWHASYAAFWQAPVALTVGPWQLAADLRTWVDEGLMTLFFLVVGLEAKRERDLGALRDGRRLTVPVLAGLVAMAGSVAVYLAVTAGTPAVALLVIGIAIASAVAAGTARRRATILGPGELGGTALSAGVGFTVALMIASRAFDGALLGQAKVGILATALLAPVLAAAALSPLRRLVAGAAAAAATPHTGSALTSPWAAR